MRDVITRVLSDFAMRAFDIFRINTLVFLKTHAELASGAPVKRPEAVMSTAEAVNVGVAASMSARYFGDGTQ